MTPRIYHGTFRQRLLRAVPRTWSRRREVRGSVMDPPGKWRADVLAWKDDCTVALEAQVGTTDVERRSDDYLATGVWPLWFFDKIPGRYRESPVLSIVDIDKVPQILAVLLMLPAPPPTWADAQARLREALKGA